MIKNHCDLYSSFTCEKKSRHLYSVFFPLPFFLLSSVTQMLTTQADRFSAEEVHCSPPAHANYHHYNSFVSVGELNWKKKKYKDERHHDDHLRPRQTHFHAKKQKPLSESS